MPCGTRWTPVCIGNEATLVSEGTVLLDLPVVDLVQDLVYSGMGRTTKEEACLGGIHGYGC